MRIYTSKQVLEMLDICYTILVGTLGKKPMVRLEGKTLNAVTNEGVWVCTLIDFERCTFERSAKQVLDKEGYLTDWAKWDNDGRMIKLSEDFE